MDAARRQRHPGTQSSVDIVVYSQSVVHQVVEAFPLATEFSLHRTDLNVIVSGLSQ